MRVNLKPIWQTGQNILAAVCAVVLAAVEVGMAVMAIRYFAQTVASPHGASDRGSPGASATLDQCADWSPA